MEIVIIEKKTFEALLAAAETLAGKVGELCRRCSDKRESKWLDGQEVCRLKPTPPRALQTLPDRRKTAFAQVTRKFSYRPEEVERLLKEAALPQSAREDT